MSLPYLGGFVISDYVQTTPIQLRAKESHAKKKKSFQEKRIV